MTLVERLLMAPIPFNICFAESDAGEAEGAGGETEAEEAPVEGGEEETPALEVEGEAQPDEEEAEDVEWEGKTYNLPKSIKEGLLRQSDYTQKTQAIAAKEAAYEAKVKSDTEMFALRGAVHDEVLKLKDMDTRLSEWDKVTQEQWDKLEAEDPTGFVKAQNTWMKERTQRATVFQQAQAKHNELQNKQTAAERDAISNADVEVAKVIKGWSPDKKAAVVKYATDRGIPQGGLTLALQSPAAIQMMHESMLYREALAKPVIAKPGTPAVRTQTPVKPVTRVTGKTPGVSADPSDTDDPKTWLAKREAQLAKKRAMNGQHARR